MHHIHKAWNKTKKKLTVKFLTDPDSDLWYKACQNVEVVRGTNIETTLIPHLSFRIDAATQIILKKYERQQRQRQK